MEIDKLTSVVNNDYSVQKQSSTQQTIPVQQESDAVQSLSETQQATTETVEEELDTAVDKLNKTAKIYNSALEFQVHEATNRTMVSVVDKDSDKVIRQIPSEEVLDMVAKIEDYMGLIFDKKA